MLQQQDVIRVARQRSWECARGLRGVTKGAQGVPNPQLEPQVASTLPFLVILTVPQALDQPNLPTTPYLPQRVS